MKNLFILIITLVTLVSCTNQSVHSNYLDVRVDSISKHQRYTTIPFYYYHYHTEMGIIPSNELKYELGDTIRIKIIK